MGADLIVEVLPCAVFEDGEQVTLFSDIAAEVRRRLLSNKNTPGELLEDFYPGALMDLDENDGEDEIQEGEISAALGIFEETFDEMVRQDSRATLGFIDTAGRPWVIHGGTTWSDDPSDWFQGFVFTEVAGVFNLPFPRG